MVQRGAERQRRDAALAVIRTHDDVPHEPERRSRLIFFHLGEGNSARVVGLVVARQDAGVRRRARDADELVPPVEHAHRAEGRVARGGGDDAVGGGRRATRARLVGAVAARVGRGGVGEEGEPLLPARVELDAGE